jgi:hypothetical protein
MFHVNLIYTSLVHHKRLVHAYTRIFQFKNQAWCQYKYGSLYHVIQLWPETEREWTSVVNNVHFKKPLIPSTPVPSPGAKGGGLRFRHVKVYWVYIKLEIPFLYMSVSIYAFFIFTSTLRAYVILLFNLPTLNKTYLIWMIIFAKIYRFRQFFLY